MRALEQGGGVIPISDATRLQSLLGAGTLTLDRLSDKGKALLLNDEIQSGKRRMEDLSEKGQALLRTHGYSAPSALQARLAQVQANLAPSGYTPNTLEKSLGVKVGEPISTQANIGRGVLDPREIGTSLKGGVGETIKGAGSVASYLGGKVGAPDLGAGLQVYGTKVSEKNYQEPAEFKGWRSFLDPKWLQRNFARTIPTSAALVLPAIATGGLTAGLSTLGGAAVAGTLNRAMESAMEAGGTYEEALAKGMSKQEADDAADKTFRNNMKLVGLDIGEFAAAFLPGVKAVSTAGKAAVAAGRLALAGGQEAIEEGFQEKYQREALGEKFSWKAPQTQEAMAIGGLMGVGLGGAGEVSRLSTEIHKAAAAKLPDAQRLTLNTEVATRMAEGKTWAAASREAMDTLGKQNPAISAAVRDATQEVQARYAKTPQEGFQTEAAQIAPIEAPQVTQTGQVSVDGQTYTIVGKIGSQWRLQATDGAYRMATQGQMLPIGAQTEATAPPTQAQPPSVALEAKTQPTPTQSMATSPIVAPVTSGGIVPAQGGQKFTKGDEVEVRVNGKWQRGQIREVSAKPYADSGVVYDYRVLTGDTDALVNAKAVRPVGVAPSAVPKSEEYYPVNGQQFFKNQGEANNALRGLNEMLEQPKDLVTKQVNARGGKRWAIVDRVSVPSTTTKTPPTQGGRFVGAGKVALGESAVEAMTAPPTPDLLKQTVTRMSEEDSLSRAIEDKFGKPVGFASDAFKTVREVIDAVRHRDDVKVSDADVERVLNATHGAKTWLGGIVEKVGSIGDAFKDIFQYEWTVKAFPRFQDQLRRFQGVARDAQVYALETYLNIVKHLKSAQEFTVFRKMIVLNDLAVDLQSGVKVPGDLTLEQVQQAQAELRPKVTDSVRKAIEAHNTIFKTAWAELQRRGKVSLEKDAREAYYPHKVMDYIRDANGDFPAISRRLKEPYRYYLKKRGGTARLIDTDYLTITMNHLTKFYMDNAVDDFALEIARDYDVFPKLTAEQKKSLHIEKRPEVGKRYDIDGKVYFGWQYLNRFCKNPAIMEVMSAAVQADDLAKMEGMKQKHTNTYIIPQEIADRIATLREPRINSHILNLARASSWMWKNIVLGPLGAGIPFQVNNFVGDVLNLYREDPAAVLLVPEGWKAATAFEKNMPGKYKDLLDIAEQTRVVQAGLMRTSGIPYNPLLRTLEPGRFFLNNFNVFEKWQGLGERRELSVRLAKLMKDMERIGKGESPQVKMFDVKKLEAAGMKPIEIAGKAAREFGVDYGKLTPEQKAILRDVLFPFSTFYLGNLSNWVAYVKRNPGEFTAKFLVPLAVLAAWNNFAQPDKEEKLPDYYRTIPHLITGYETPDGKPIVITFQTPLDQASKLFGLEITGDLVRQVATGKKSIEDAAKELGEHVFGGAQLEAVKDLLNPFIKAEVEIYGNKKMFNGAPIVDEAIKDTPEGKKVLREYRIQQWFSPVGQYAKQAKELTEPAKALKSFFAKGPADIRRAVGIREVDLEKETVSRFYDKLDSLEGSYAVWKDKRDKGQAPGAFTDLAEMKRLQAVARSLTDQWKVIDHIKVDKSRTQDEKDKEVRERYLSMARRIGSVLNPGK